MEGGKDGYKKGQIQVSTVNLRGSRSFTANLRLTAISGEVVRKPLAEGTIIVLENIYYDFNKSNIRTGDAHDLESLVALMKKYSSMEVELGAHTDSRGASTYNLQLSLRRAESARNFLIQQGIAAHRIKAVGYGETELRNKCTDDVNCTEAEHQYNRRTEVKVTKIDEPATFDQPTDLDKH
jgi:outer membrane protein OmpA-like peptidoglycan-associated protein